MNIKSDTPLDITYNLADGTASDQFNSGEKIKIVNITYPIKMEVSARADATGTSDIMVYPITATLPECLSSVVLFELSNRNRASPMIVFLPALPSVTGRIQMDDDCNSTLEFHFRWELSSLGLVNGVLEWRELSVEQPNSVRFQLSQAIAGTGLYQLTLTLGMGGFNITDSMYIQVDHPPLVAGIVGRSVRQVAHSHTVTLDAQTESYDPAAVSSPGLLFSWACYTVQDGKLLKYTSPLNTDFSYRSFPACGVTLPRQGRTTTPASAFSAGDFVLFEVTVSKGDRHAVAAIGLEVLNTDVPVIVIK